MALQQIRSGRRPPPEVYAACLDETAARRKTRHRQVPVPGRDRPLALVSAERAGRRTDRPQLDSAALRPDLCPGDQPYLAPVANGPGELCRDCCEEERSVLPYV